MTTLRPPLGAQTVSCVPADLSSSVQLSVYDGYPDSQPWAETFKARFHSGIAIKSYDQVEFISALETGAPFGEFKTESYRVARATGIALKEPKEHSEVLGACIAQALCFARWGAAEQGGSLVLEFQAPQVIGWGLGKAGFSQEHVKARCLQQFLKQAASLMENVHGIGRAKDVKTEFTGDWGPETERVKDRISQACRLSWQNIKSVFNANPGEVYAVFLG